jgi:hypothetical protein
MARMIVSVFVICTAQNTRDADGWAELFVWDMRLTENVEWHRKRKLKQIQNKIK